MLRSVGSVRGLILMFMRLWNIEPLCEKSICIGGCTYSCEMILWPLYNSAEQIRPPDSHEMVTRLLKFPLCSAFWNEWTSFMKPFYFRFKLWKQRGCFYIFVVFVFRHAKYWMQNCLHTVFIISWTVCYLIDALFCKENVGRKCGNRVCSELTCSYTEYSDSVPICNIFKCLLLSFAWGFFILTAAAFISRSLKVNWNKIKVWASLNSDQPHFDDCWT